MQGIDCTREESGVEIKQFVFRVVMPLYIVHSLRTLRYVVRIKAITE